MIAGIILNSIGPSLFCKTNHNTALFSSVIVKVDRVAVIEGVIVLVVVVIVNVALEMVMAGADGVVP